MTEQNEKLSHFKAVKNKKKRDRMGMNVNTR